MAASVNRVTIIGTLGRDPEVRYTTDGKAICNLSLATNSSWKNAQGEKVEKVEWHRVVMYGKVAEITGEYARKGRQIYIEGRLETRKWQDKETGADKYTTEIVADQMQLLGGREDSQQASQAPQRQAAPARTQQQQQSKPAQSVGGLSDIDEDIPFRHYGAGQAWRVI